MKKLLFLIPLLVDFSVVNAQEYRYSYQYKGLSLKNVLFNLVGNPNEGSSGSSDVNQDETDGSSGDWDCSSDYQFLKTEYDDGAIEKHIDLSNDIYMYIWSHNESIVTVDIFKNYENIYTLTDNYNFGDFPFTNLEFHDHIEEVAHIYNYNELISEVYVEEYDETYTTYSVCKQEIEYNPNGFPFI